MTDQDRLTEATVTGLMIEALAAEQDADQKFLQWQASGSFREPASGARAWVAAGRYFGLVEALVVFLDRPAAQDLLARRTRAEARWLSRTEERGQAPAIHSTTSVGRPTDLENWWSRYELLAAFVAEHGRQPIRSDSQQGLQVQRWAEKQRAAVLAHRLDDEQVRSLEAIPGWWWTTATRTPWEEGFEMLKTWVETHGSLPKAADETECGFRVGRWVKEQRTAALRDPGKGRITNARRAALETVPGWTWVGRRGAPLDQDAWLATYRKVVEHIEQHGRRPAHDTRLGRWLALHRREVRSEKVHAHTQERRQLLAALAA